MTRIQAILLGFLALGASAVPGLAFAAPSATCTEADNGGLDISGTLPATLTINRTPAAGETFLVTLQGGVTNSLLIVNGTVLFSGETTGTRSFKGTGAQMTIVYDIQGTGAMRFSCEAAPPDPDPDPPDPPSSATKTTETITGINSPLSGTGGSVIGSILLRTLLNDLPDDEDPVACPPPAMAANRLRLLSDELDRLNIEGSFLPGAIAALEADVETGEGDVIAAGLTFDGAAVREATSEVNRSRRSLNRARDRLDAINQRKAQIEAEIAGLKQCTATSASQFAASPQHEPNSPLAAFGLFDQTQMLIDEGGLKAWATGRASLLGGGPTDLAGAQGGVSIGAAKRLDDTTGIGGEIGIAGGRTRIGADNTTADFTALSAMIAASHEVAHNVQLSFGAAGGFAWNSVEMGGATGSFGSAAISGFASISSRHEMDGIVIAPSASLSASNTQSEAYALSDSTAVGATSVSQLDMSGLLRISKSLEMVEADMMLDPFVAFGAGYGIASGGSTGGISGSLSLGLDGSRPDGIGFGFSGVLGGTASGVWSAGISGRIGGSF